MFSETKKISLTPLADNHLASSIISVGGREINEPRNCGIAQNVHRLSQPLAIFSEAIGALSKRFLINRAPWPNLDLVASLTLCRSIGEIGRIVRRSRGTCTSIEPPLRIVLNRLEIS